MRQCIAAIIFAFAALGAMAQTGDLIALQTRQASAGWEAVGRLDIAGKGFCTAALIRERLILTAAHCLYDADGGEISSDRFVFHAGLRDGRAVATRNVLRAVPHPDYLAQGDRTGSAAVAMDIAVLELDRPIREARLRPYLIADRPLAGDMVGVVSYGRGREDAPSLQEVCAVLGRQTGVIVMTCDVDFGSSGSPVFSLRGGEPQIVSVVSAMAMMEGEKVSLGTSLDGPLSVLLSHYAALPPARPVGMQSVLAPRDRGDIGAKFITVD
jgi:protease YdgD